MHVDFREDEAFAREMDERDPLRACRDLFETPTALQRQLGRPVVYMCGNSLGLQPKSAREAAVQELDDWAAFAVEGHFHARNPWFAYHEIFRDMGARLVGGKPGEVVMMNSLTVNLHLMMVSFYRPTQDRFKIVIEDDAFPSDSHAVQSQLR
ncbi:MAG: kynureninase, partial [Planctomycetota bacterium]|nr:kynureninase [Planctomycetota bacterium]